MDMCMDKMFNTDNIINIFKKQINKKTVIVIDNLESLLSTNEKSVMVALQKLNDKKWYCPIIFISNGKHSKLLSHFKKTVLCVRFFEPFPSHMKKILDTVAKKENIIVPYSLAHKIVEYAQSDIRRLISILEDFKSSQIGQTLTLVFFNEYINTYQKKDVNIKLHKGAHKLIYEYKGIDECLRYYETEKVLLPLMLHLHYVKCVVNDCGNEKRMFNTVDKISNIISFSDVMENFIYSDQNWTMHELHGIYSCGIISYYLHRLKITNITDQTLSFPLDLNKTSIRQINKKNIINADKYFVNMNVFDYIYMTKILYNIVNSDDLFALKRFLGSYNITLENIESILKIDKIGKYKTTISAKKKKLVSTIPQPSGTQGICKITHTKYRKDYYSFMKIRDSMLKDFELGNSN